ncbi:succinyl-diaminopimelate desuccinylase [Alsobacter metallidurans]|uniref:Succinyl-diaminopimelate desuccinylase n=1 Tax=Alsobacter metallidurans TaxID=340221 RepID=A0A917MI61_9HYPH|nr:succinyl-diaminopimelate desuccinylase [Alsobacter metallidurans]GGH08847.1 succinyl-diaminopimelate desuccinylase [Alsobacter metallidurans]
MLDAHDPVALTQALIRCPSVTPHEAGALQLLADVLAKAGFETHLLTFSEPGTPDVQNLYARIGREAPCLLFAGHTDVVPPGDESRWTHAPFGGDIVDGVLYGRGATDMKSGVAASVSATLRWLASHGGRPPRGSIAFLLTGDEEGPAVNGTVKLLEWAHARGERFNFCVLGEPTNPNALGDMIKIGRRGSLTGEITVEGTQGHVAYPDLAENPIRGLVRLLDALMAKPLDAGTAQFGPSNLEFTTVDVGNPSTNVIPASARAVFNVRFNDLWTHETLADEIRRRLAEAAGNAVRYDVAFRPSNAPAFLTPPGAFVSLAADAVEAVTGRRPALSTTGGTSDARFIKDYCPVIEFGLVGKTMHKVDENADVADIEALTGIYEEMIRRAFA